MNKKTFALSVLFVLLTLGWLGLNIYWEVVRHNTAFDIIIAVLFVVAALGMACNEFKKKKRRHLSDVNKHQIP